MRVDIKNKLDLEKLDKVIAEWEKIKYGDKEYSNLFLIMAKDTEDAMRLECNYDSMAYKHNVYNYSTYKGYTIAICNAIPFGEVEIR